MLKIDRRVALGEVVVRRLEATTQEPLMRVWKLALLPAALLAATPRATRKAGTWPTNYAPP